MGAGRIVDHGEKLLKPVNLAFLAEDAIPIYEVVPFKGKGLGVVARRHIPKFSKVMIDQAVLQIDGFNHGLVNDSKEFDRKFNELSEDKQKEVMALQGKDLADILRTN